MNEEIKDIKKLLVEDNLTYSGQLRFLAYTVKLEQENKQLKHILDELENWLNEFHEYSGFQVWEIRKKLKELRGRE